MKFKREIIAIILIICMLFTVSAISAADSTTDAVSATNATVEAASGDVANDNNLAIKNDVEILGETDDGSFASLNTKISGATDTVYLWNDYEYSSSYSSTDGIFIGNSITIDGQGHKIDAKGQTRIFDYETNGNLDVTIKNTIFANGRHEYGGAIYWYPDGGTLTLINCTFINNTATDQQYGGGALLVYEASINVVNSTFINNSGAYGGAISGEMGEINNCSFYNNSLTSSTGLGSAIILSSGTVSNSIFLNNAGYVIYGSNVVANYNWFGNTVSNFDVQPNVVSSGLTKWYVLNMSINEANNIATVSLNNLYDGTQMNPCDTYALPSVTFNVKGTGATVAKNAITTDKDGDASFGFTVTENTGVLTVSSNGVSISKDVVDLTDDGSITALNTKIQDAITNGESEVKLYNDYIYGSSELITNTLQIKNGQPTSNNGIGISSDLIIDGQGFTIDGNNRGARIFSFFNASISIKFKNINFINCVDSLAPVIFGICEDVEIINCTFKDNHANSNTGGAVYVKPTNVKIVNSTFEDNYANAKSGGALYLQPGNSCEVINSTFIKNKGLVGGAIYINPQSSNVNGDVSGCIFIENDLTNPDTSQTTYAGSAIYCGGSAIYTVNNCIFINNARTANVALGYATVDCNNNWWGNTFDNKLDSGLVSTNGDYNSWLYLDLTVDNENAIATISLNNLNDGNKYSDYALPKITLNIEATNANINTTTVTLDENGEAKVNYEMTQKTGSLKVSYNGIELTKEIKLFVQDSFTSLKNQINDGEESTVYLHQNYTYNSGFDDGLTNGIDITKSITIDGNGYTIDAKGLSNIFYFNDDTNTKTLTLKNMIFTNAVGENGAAIYFKGNKIEIINCTFINNKANGQGDVVYIADAISVDNKITESTFINNTGDNSVVYINLDSDVSKLNLSNSIFIGNDATYDVKGTSNVVVDYNWWGNTKEDYETNSPKVDGATLNNWLVLNITANTNTNIATVSLNNLYENNGIRVYESYALPAIDVNIKGTDVNVQKSTVNLGNTGKATTALKLLKPDATLTASYENIETTDEIHYVVVDDGSFKALNDIIRFSSENEVIELTQDYVYSDTDSLTNGIQITKTITINGNNHIIDAKENCGIFLINSPNVVLNGITFKNGAYAYGGAIYASKNAECLTVDNCTFINNTASKYGGAIYSGAEEQMGNIINSKFINNSAQSYGGAIFNNAWSYSGLNNIDRCIFINNTASDSAVYFLGYGKIQNSIFLNNSASYEVDSYYSGSVTFNNDWFGNTINELSQPSVYSSSFKWLYLDIKFYEEYAIVSLNNLYSSYGVKSVATNYNLPEITLNINSTTLDLKNKNNITLDNTGKVIVPYEMIGETGALTVSYNGISLTKDVVVPDFDSIQTLIDNTEEGSVIELDKDYTYNDVDEITEGIIINKNITIDGKGHTIDAKEKTRIFNVQANGVTFKNIIFANGKGNLGSDDGGNHGGAIYYNLDNTESINFNVINCTFVDNTADVDNYNHNYQGGAIYIKANNGKFNITDSIFKNNKATGNGGAIYLNTKNSEFNLYNSSFVANTANNGGALCIETDGTTITIDRCLFRENIQTGGINSADYGSAIKWITTNDDDRVNVIKNSIFLDNIGDGLNKYNYKVFSYTSGNVNINENWWGTNALNSPDAVSQNYFGHITPTSWLYLDGELSSSQVYVNEPVVVKFILKLYDQSLGVCDYDNGKLPFVNLTVSSYDWGTVDKEFASLNEEIVYIGTKAAKPGMGTGPAVIVNNINSGEFWFKFVQKEHSIITLLVDNPLTMYNGKYYNYADILKFNAKKSKITIESSDSSVVGLGVNYHDINALNTGNAIISFDYNEADADLYDETSVDLVINVRKIPMQIVVTNFESNEILVYATDTIYLNVTLLVDDVYEQYATNQWGSLKFTHEDDDVNGNIFYEKGSDFTANGASVNGTLSCSVSQVGTSNLTLSIDNKLYDCENAIIKFTIDKKPTAIELDHSDALEFKVDDVSKINATLINGSVDAQLKYKSSNSDVVTVDENTGEFSAVGSGTAIITVKYDGNAQRNESTKEVTVTVNKYGTETVFSGHDAIELEIDETSQVSATLTAEDNADLGSPTYESSDESVATVNPVTGEITAVSLGSATITAKYDATRRYADSRDSVTVNIRKISTVITLTSDSEVTMNAFGNSQITATLTPSVAGTLSYKSSNESVATVDADGKITAVAGGKANITISFAGDDDRYAGAEDVNVSVTVNKLPTTIKVDATNEVDVLASKSLGATVDNGRTLHYVSLNPDIVTVDDSGVITGVIGGTGIINITFDEDGQYQAKYATVTVTVNKIASTITVEPIVINVFESQLISSTIYGDGVVSYVSCDPAIVTVNATTGNITGVKGGKANVTISIAEGAQYLAKEANVTVTVNKLPTTITVNPAITVDVDGTNTIEANANHGRALEFVSLDETIVKVDSATGVITGVTGGTANVTVKFHEDDQYLAKEVNVTVTVNKLTPTITVNPIEIDVFEDKLISPIVVSDGAVTYVSCNPSIVTVDENTGEITGVIGGKANVTIKVSETPRYEAKDANVTVTVNKLPTIITVEPTMRLKMGDNDTIVATVISGADIHYQTVSDLITVDAAGLVKAIKGGIAEVTVSADATDEYQANSTTVTVTVARLPDDDTPITVSALSKPDVSALYNFGGDSSNLKYFSSNDTIFNVSDEGILEAKVGGEANLTIKDEILGESVTIKVIVNKLDTPFEVSPAISINVYQKEDLGVNIPQKADRNQLRYQSSNPDVVSVDENGLITGIIGGTATITISYVEDGQFVANSTDVTVTVNKLATTIKINESEFSLFVDGKDVINATTNNEGGLYYASNSPCVLLANNVVTGVGEGTAEIKVIALENEKYLAKTEIVKVTVNKIPSVISVEATEFTIDVDGNVSLGAILNHEGDLTYKYNESIISVENGIATGIIGGKTNITISYAGDNKYAAAEDVNVSVTVNKLPTTIIVEPTISVDADGTNTINATADGRTLEFVSLDESIVTVDENGLITGIKGGQANVTVKFQETDKYLGDEVNVTVTVNRLTSTITVAPIDINVFESQLIDPTIMSDGVVSYVSCDPTVVTVNATNGNITAVKGGKVNVTIKVAESDKYLANEVNVTITVNKLTTVIVVNSTIDVDYGKTAVIEASAGGRTLEFISLDETIVTVDDSGLITTVKAGVANVTVKFRENDYYLGDEVNVTVTVNKLSTVIVVNSTIDVDYGKTAVIEASAEGRTLEFISLDETVVTVDDSGLITAVKGGVANVTVKFSENDYYLGDEVNVTVTVNRLPIKISISYANNVIVGGTSTIVLTLTETDATGFAILYVNGTEYPINISQTKSLDVVLDKVGDYDVYAIYQGDDKYQTAQSNPETVKAFPKYENAISVNVTENIRVGDKVEINASSESGVIDVYVDGVKQADSEGKVVIDSLSAGQHTIKLESNETDKYVANSTEFTIDVVKKQSNIVIDIEGDLIADSNIKINIDYNGSNLVVYIDGEPLIDYELKATAGNHLIVASLSEDDEYYGTTETYNFTVSKKPSEIYVSGTTVTVGESTLIKVEDLPNDATGIVVINLNGTKYSMNITENKTLSVVLDKAGNYKLSAQYLGDDKYLPSDEYVGNDILAKDKKINAIEVQYPDVIYAGDDVNVTITSDGDALEVYLDGIKQTLKDGILAIENISSGTHVLEVVSQETSQFKLNSTSRVIDVAKKQAEITIDDIIGVKAGDNVAIVVTTDSDSEVVIYVDGVKLQSNIIENIAAGSHTVIASVEETDLYLKATANRTFTVDKLPASIEVNASNITQGQATEITVTADVDEGVVVVKLNETEVAIDLAKGKSTTVVLDTPGIYEVTANYLGSDKYESAAAASFIIEVFEKATPEVNVTIPEIKAGEDGKVNISIPNATGEVHVIIDGVDNIIPLNENGTADFTIPEMGAGNHSVVIVYPGDDTHEAKVVTQTVNVEKQIAEANITSPSDVKEGESATVKVEIANATGKVVIIVDGVEEKVPLVNGTIDYPLDNLSAGNHSVVVIYPGDDTHSSTYSSSSFNVEAEPVVVKLATELTNITIADDLNITAYLVDENGKPVANAEIIYRIGDETKYINTAEDGSFTINGVAKSKVTIDYAGNETLLATNTSITLQNVVTPPKLGSYFNVSEGTTFETYAVETAAGEKGALYAFTLRDSNGDPIVNATVTFAYKTVVFNSTTNENGTLYLGISTYLAQDALCAMSYVGDEKHNATFVAFNFKIMKKPTVVKAYKAKYKVKTTVKKYTVTLKTYKLSSRDGKVYLKAGKVLKIKVNGRNFYATTNSKGQATFKITNLNKKGVYIAKVIYAGSDTYAGSMKKVKITVY